MHRRNFRYTYINHICELMIFFNKANSRKKLGISILRSIILLHISFIP